MEELTDPVIREATPEDVYAIRKFHARSWLETYPNEHAGVPKSWVLKRWQNWDTKEKLEESSRIIAEIIANKNQLYRIAVVGNDVVALMHAARDGVTQELGGLYVDKRYQGRGLAQELMEQANSFWDSSRPVELSVVDYNERAKRFYEKQGFQKIYGSEYLHADKMPSIKMRREALA